MKKLDIWFLNTNRVFSRILYCLLLVLVSGCSGKPRLQLQEVRSAQFGNTIASSAVLAELVTAYQRASLIREDVETTHPVRVDVVLASGETLVLWGGDTGFQTVAFRGRQFNLQGEELEALFHRLLAFHQTVQ